MDEDEQGYLDDFVGLHANDARWRLVRCVENSEGRLSATPRRLQTNTHMYAHTRTYCLGHSYCRFKCCQGHAPDMGGDKRVDTELHLL